MQHYTISANLNKLVVLSLVIFSCSGSAAERLFSEDERRTVESVIGEFRRTCAQKVTVESEALERVREAESKSRAEGNKEVDRCFQDHLSLISGVYYIYEKLCATITGSPVEQPDNVLARRLLSVNKYISGIRPYHSQLSNCLLSVPLQAGRKFVTPLNALNLSPEIMSKAITGITVVDPYPATQVPFR